MGCVARPGQSPRSDLRPVLTGGGVRRLGTLHALLRASGAYPTGLWGAGWAMFSDFGPPLHRNLVK